MNRINKFEKEEQKRELANQYKDLIRIAQMEDYFVKSEILQLLWGCNDRKVRYIVEDVLHLYPRFSPDVLYLQQQLPVLFPNFLHLQ